MIPSIKPGQLWMSRGRVDLGLVFVVSRGDHETWITHDVWSGENDGIDTFQPTHATWFEQSARLLSDA